MLYTYFIWVAKIVLDSLLNNILMQIIEFKQQLPPKQFPFNLQTSGILTNEDTFPNVNAVWREETSPLSLDLLQESAG